MKILMYFLVVKAYNTRLTFQSQEDFEKILALLRAQRDCVNAAYHACYDLEKLSVKDLHHKFYKNYLADHEVPAQMVIRSYKEALASFRSMRSNKHAKTIPHKKALSLRLDKRIYTLRDNQIRITSLEKRVSATIHLYPRLAEILDRLDPRDPLIFERDGEIWISLAFEETHEKIKEELAVGVDLGVRRQAATSEGKIFIDKKFNGRIRRIRHNKKALQVKGTKAARRKKRKIGKREARMKRAALHALANEILRSTSANVLVLEDLKGIKHKKKKKKQTKQTSLYQLRLLLTYKAPCVGKRVVTVSPRDTSLLNCLSGRKDGVRRGIRYLLKDGKVLDADWNAACNIAFRYARYLARKFNFQLPVSWRVPLDGQAAVNQPIACQSGQPALQAQTL